MRTYLQITLAVLTARLLLALVGTWVIKRLTRDKPKAQRALAVAIADELERRFKERERRAWR